MTAASVSLLHLCDSLFPVGAFAHSDGLESAVVSGRVHCADDVRDWLAATLNDLLTPFEAPLVRDAMHAARRSDGLRLLALGEESNAMRPARAARDASSSMGARLLKTWQHVSPSHVVAGAIALDRPLGFPVSFGIVAEASGLPPIPAIEGYCYMRLAAGVSAAMRLMPLGQLEAHAALAATLRSVPAAAARVASGAAPARSFTPPMDIAVMDHQYIHSRLFRS